MKSPPAKGQLIANGRQAIAGETLNFQYNPTTISENRTVKYHFSEGQGQYLPITQFGLVEPVEISFSLLFHNNKGLKDELASLRRIMSPRTFTDTDYYQQPAPLQYLLNLGDYGVFLGVVEDLTMKIEKYHHQTMVPQQISAQMRFRVVSGGPAFDVTSFRAQTGRVN